MHKDLKTLLDNYSEKQADIDFIYDALEIIINNYKINNMINKINIEDYTNNVLGYYNYINNELFLNIILTYGKSQNIYLHNLRVLQIILHECNHILQYQKTETQNDIETEFLKIILGEKIILKQIEPYLNGKKEIKDKEKLNLYTTYIQNHGNLNRKFGRKNPTERIAEINSYKEILNIITKNTVIYKEYQSILKEKQLLGYEIEKNQINSPFIEYVNELINFHYDKEICIEFKEKLLKKSKTMSLEKKMYYGLPITLKEYNNKNIK